jgi:hypothetical protein
MSYLIVIPILAFAFVLGWMIGYCWKADHGER